MTNTARFLLACGLAAAAGCAAPEAPVALKAPVMKGISYTHERTEKVDGWLSVQSGGTQTRQPLTKDEHRVYQDDVLEVDGTRVTKLRRKILEWTLKRQAPGEAARVEVPRTMVGKSVVLRRTDLGTAYEEADGLPADELKANLLGSLEALLSLPPDPVAVGGEWALDGDRIVDIFGSEGSSRPFKARTAAGTGRLDSIDGDRVAHVTIRIASTGALRSLLDVGVALDLTLRFRIDLASGLPLSIDAHADGKISGEVDRDGKPAIYTGAFAFEATGVNTYR